MHPSLVHVVKHYQHLLHIHGSVLGDLMQDLPVTGKITLMLSRAMQAIVNFQEAFFTSCT